MTDRSAAFRLAERARDMCAEDSSCRAVEYGIEVEQIAVDDVTGVKLNEYKQLESASTEVLRLKIPKF